MPFDVSLIAIALPLLAQSPATPSPQPTPTQATPATPELHMPEPHPVELLRAEAARLLGLIDSIGAQRYLISTNWLTFVENPRIVYYNKAEHDARTPDEFAALPEDQRAKFEEKSLAPTFFYTTMYGSPHAYTRPLDLYCSALDKHANCLREGVRVLDFGCGGVVHLRLLASLGMDAVGVDVDPVLKAYFREQTDQGKIEGALVGGNQGPAGNVKLVWGRWPAEEPVKSAVGSGFDLILSKNTLKNGYVNTEREIPERQRVKLGVENDAFVAAVADALKDGGVFLIYNICPAQKKPEEGYIPWADGRCPFPREMLEKHGLHPIEFDKDDSVMIRTYASALEWDTGPNPMDLEHDLFATYTLCRKGKPEATQPHDPPAPPPGAK